MTNILHSKDFFETAIPVAQNTGNFQKEKLHSHFKIEFKGEINPVTEIDRASEEMIVSAVLKKFPHHDIMGEEGKAPRRDSPYKWIIDPLDGTVNYSHGYPHFAISIALEYEGAIIGGVIHDPMRAETFSAYKNEGAFLNHKKIRVSHTKKLDHALLGTGFAYNVRKTKNNNLNHFQNFIMKAQAVRRDGVAAIDVCYVACGRYDGFWELNLFPWDTAAGLIIAEESGARVTRFDGSPYTVYEKDILVSNGLVHDEMIRVLTTVR